MSRCSETSIEVNPATVTEDKLTAYKNAGINRLSIGLQSANDEELKLLTRNHNSDDVKEAVSLARKAGFENISLDVMIGIENDKIVYVPFAKAIKNDKPIDRELVNVLAELSI